MANTLSMPALYGICMGLGLAVMGQSGNPRPAFEPELVQCFKSPTASTTGTSETASKMIKASVARRAARDAARACQSGWCDNRMRYSMNYNLAHYLAERRAVTTDLYRSEGDAGLAKAAQLFSTPDDVKLASDAASLYAKGRLDPAELQDERDALALVMMKSADSFKPCVALYRSSPNVAPYVY
ncbi:MAG: hypothetical protein AB7S74_11795 [Hyphomicrobium sp.]